MRKLFTTSALGIAAILAPTLALAQSLDDGKAMLKAIVAQAKAQGAAKTAESLTAGTDGTKCKEKPGIGCFVATANSVMVGNAKNPKMVGQEFPADFADIDGTPIVGQVIGPFKSGKTSWEAKYKFAMAGSTKAVLQHAFCEKLDATHLVCVTVSQ